MGDEEEVAGEGQVWVCTACGKTSKNRMGPTVEHRSSYGWDVSCSIHSVLCLEDHLTFKGGRVIDVKPGGVVEKEASK